MGELSVTYNRFIRKWIMLYNCFLPRWRGINLRTADQPWGPWSEPQMLFDPWKDNGYGHFMHVSWLYDKMDYVHDPNRENVWGGEYAPYEFGDLAAGDAASTTIYFTMSTWNPYTVADEGDVEEGGARVRGAGLRRGPGVGEGRSGKVAPKGTMRGWRVVARWRPDRA